jgi:hypothetical protein
MKEHYPKKLKIKNKNKKTLQWRSKTTARKPKKKKIIKKIVFFFNAFNGVSKKTR